ncbi:MAG: transcription antitermination factor NusB, partial [Calditrichaeota bacterium]
QVLYALELSGNSLNTVLKNLMPKCDEPPPALSFTKKIVEKTFNSREEFDQLIQRYSANWMFDRIAVLDLIIMRIAICEFLNFHDIPLKVSIDEALELAKKYSTHKSSGYINGILDAVLLELKAEQKISKTGRGMMNSQNRKNPDEPHS